MAVNYQSGDYSRDFNSVYKITLDMGGWDKTTIQVEAPISGAIVVYGTNNSGFQLGVTQGNANLATDFQPVQVTNLATGTAVNSISAAGNYKYEVNAQFLRLQGSPAAAGTAVYGLKFFHSKID